MGLREIFLPREKIFFRLLEQESNNVLEGAKILRELFLNYESLPEKRDQIKDIEHRGDETVHIIYEQLMKAFVTPIDREEIGKLASLYDDVLDLIYGLVNRLYLYEIEHPTEGMRKFIDLVVRSAEETDLAFAVIHDMKVSDIEARCNQVDKLEKEADALLNESVAALFKLHDATAIIKLKEIYEILEAITDTCQDVVQVIRNIVLEYS